MAHQQVWPAITALLLLNGANVASAAANYQAMNGQELYDRFCAACHGAQAHGDGPVAASFSIDVPDLTLLAQRHGEKFSADLIERIIDGRQLVAAHGERNMPVWGEEFTRSEIGHPEAERATHTIITKIADYLISIQHEARRANDSKHITP